MPYKLKHVKKGWYVTNQQTGRKLSNKPISRTKAVGQMRAVYRSEGLKKGK